MVRLRELREDHDLNQADVGRYLGLSQKAYGDYELGNSAISVDNLIKLAVLYDVDMNYICGLTPIKRPFTGKLPRMRLTPASLKDSR